MKSYRWLAATALAGMSIGIAGVANAQEAELQTAPPETDQTAPETESATGSNQGDDIVITGSRIARNVNLESAVPITSVSIQELTSTGDVSLGNALNQLPSLGSTYSSANSTRFIGTAGLSLLDLRRLGTGRTLVLVNGRRHITSQPGSFAVDVNTIPTDLVERVDTVTGGQSGVYGSDAMAGVVNFVTKRDYEGLVVRGQSGITSRGDRPSYFLSATGGQNFSEGRGNIAGSLEYAYSDVLYFTERDDLTGAYSGRNQFNAVENTGPNLNPNAGALRPGGEAAIGNGIPDTAFLYGVKNNSISEGGLFTATCPTAAATGESAAAFAARRAATCTGLANPSSSNPLAQFGRTYVFMPDGSLIANPCLNDLRPFGSANCVGGLGSTLRLTGMLQPKVERYSANFLASYEVSEAFRPFLEAKFVRVDSLQEGQPTFFNNSFSINNPFLTDQARAQLVANLAPGATSFTAQRFNVDFGGRGEVHQRDTFRAVVGADGTFNDDWRYEVSFNYGRLETFYRTEGNLSRSRYARSINAVRNGAGQIVCAVNADTSATNDDASCVPVNLFGNGAPSQAALDYFLVDSTRDQWAEQYNAVAYVSGDMSQLFELPGGPIGFVIGGEYRRESAFSAYDALTSSGDTFLNIIPDFAPPAYDIKEAFGELRIPLLKELPFAHELTLEGSGRVSDYNLGSTGTVFAWDARAIWAPIPDLRIRGSYARSVRAPTLSDLYTANSQTFVNGLVDPCGQQNINNNPNRVRNCAAAGVPLTQTFAGTTEPFTNRAASGVFGFNRGNPELNEETSKSFTIGGVFQPRAVPGLSLSIDYYDITIDNVINSLGGQTIINQCYDNPSGIDNPFCAVVFRNPNGTFAGQSDILHGGSTITLGTTGPAFFSQPFNYAKLETSGIDFDLGYTTNITDDVRLSLRSIVSYVIQRNNFTDINDPTFRDRLLSELGDAQWRGQVNANIDFGMIDFNYRVNYIGRQTIALQYETQNAFDGRPATNPDAFPMIYYPDVFYHNFRIGADVNDRFRFYGGIDNAFDRLPPYDLLGTAGGDPFDNVGRFFYAGFEAKF